MEPQSIRLTPYQFRLLAVLALVNFVNFADRQVVVPLLPLLRQQMGATDSQLGSLQTWLLVVLAVASIPSGFLADRFSQTRIIVGGVVFWGLVRTPPDKRDMAAIEQGIKDAAHVWGMVSAELARHPYLAGDDLTLADIPWGPHLHRWFNMEFERPEVPHLRAWYDRLLQRPAYKQHLAGPVV